MILLTIQFLLFAFYVGFVWIKYGVQKSISDSWYTVNKEENWMFTLIFCYGTGFTQLLQATESAFFFFSGAFLVFVGAASDYKTWKVAKWVHYTGAVGAIVFGCLGFYEINQNLVFPAVLVSVLLLSSFKNKLWWIEIVTYLIFLTGFLNYYLWT